MAKVVRAVAPQRSMRQVETAAKKVMNNLTETARTLMVAVLAKSQPDDNLYALAASEQVMEKGIDLKKGEEEHQPLVDQASQPQPEEDPAVEEGQLAKASSPASHEEYLIVDKDW